jgi:hypothetical protein
MDYTTLLFKILLYNIVAVAGSLLVALIAVYGVLKFLGHLRPCYNCKKCTFGTGRLATLYFGKRSLKDYNHTYHTCPRLCFFKLLLVHSQPIAIFYFSSVHNLKNGSCKTPRVAYNL